MIELKWTLADGTSALRERPDAELEDLLKRTHAKFGDPNAPVWPSQELVDRVLAERANPGRTHGRKAAGRGR